MEVLRSFSEDQIEKPQENDAPSEGPPFARYRVLYTVYALALATSVFAWFIAVRAPLRSDELGTYWQIKEGFSEIWARHFLTLSSPEHAYILWFATKIFGRSEAALRIPSILAMLGAVYVLYLAARELFDRDVAIIAAVIFCLHPIIIFESIDARPYAFAALVTNTAILILLRLRRDNSNWLAALFGISAACIVWFQFLFIDILPALVLCFFVVKICDRKTLWRQFGIALAAFTLTFLPVIPIMLFLFRTSETHVYESAPNLSDLVWTLSPMWLLLCFCLVGSLALSLSALKPRQGDSQNRFERRNILVCASLALIPILILYGMSVGTSLHAFATCHRTNAIPGIALCWAIAVSRIRSRALRLLFCVLLVAFHAPMYLTPPNALKHGYAWKYALEYVEKNASVDGAPVLICSDMPEADYTPMPVDSAKESKLFAPLSYYKVSERVVPLPRGLNDEAKRVGAGFLQEATRKNERFLAVAVEPSYGTLDWLAQSASATHSVRKLGVFDGIEVMEFMPRAGQAH
jgi:hypothetical protein